jgi:hypothetical protein
VAQVAIAMHLPPDAVWAMDPADLATVIDELAGGDDDPWR